MISIAQIFAHTLKEIGVKFVFGVPSGNMIDYIEALREEEGIDFVLTGHEATASVMADVCGRLSGIPGVCFGTFGPGATNLSTGVGGALLDRSPLIAFTDEMPEKLLGRTIQMNIDHQALFLPLTKWTTRANAGNMGDIILKAAGIAVSELPGSVHVGIPTGIGQQPAIEDKKKFNYLRVEKAYLKRPNPVTLSHMEVLFRNSKKPLLAIGLLGIRAGVQNLILELAEKYQIPVVLTPMAKGIFPEDHFLYTGVLFHALSNLVARTYAEADLIIGIGYDPIEFNYEDWIPAVPLIHISTMAADVDKVQIPNVVNVIDDLKHSISRLIDSDTGIKTWNVEILKQRKKELFESFVPQEDSFDPLAVFDGLQKTLPSDGILTLDVGAHLHLAGQMWRTPEPQKLIITNGWSAMGFAIPAALAAKLCFPELAVVAVMGDGGFLMTVGELAMAKRLNLKIVFIVIKDNSLSLIRIKQEKKNFNNLYGTKLENSEIEPTNHYFGVPVVRVSNSLTYQHELKKAFEGDAPVVIEAVVDGSEYDNLVLKANK